jgi:hypothetical protein
MDKPRPSITPLPASALFHFAFPLREYAAIKAATAFFAEKLRDPKEKEVAQRALAMLESPTGLSLPSVEGEGAGSEVVPPAAPAKPDEKRVTPKGLAGLGGKKT